MSLNLPVQTAEAVEAFTYPIHYSAPFHTTVTVDADLNVNDKGYVHLSDIISVDQRTFPINGTIYAVDAAVANGYNWDIPYVAASCPTGWPDGLPVPIPVPPPVTPNSKVKATIQRVSSSSEVGVPR